MGVRWERWIGMGSLWRTDEKIREFYDIHGRSEDYKELNPGAVAYYDGLVYVNLSEIKPMIAMPFHPSNVYTIDELNANLADILHDVEQKALVSLDGAVDYSLQDKIKNGKFYVEQGIIAGCAGGGFENICAAADIIKGKNIGADEFTFSVYPASTPIYMELVKNGAIADLMEAGTVVKTAFCGPCFGAGDTPANNAFSIRHTTRNFPNREGSKLQSGQISSVALMDARSIAATAANKGFLTPATALDVEYKGQMMDVAYFMCGAPYSLLQETLCTLQIGSFLMCICRTVFTERSFPQADMGCHCMSHFSRPKHFRRRCRDIVASNLLLLS